MVVLFIAISLTFFPTYKVQVQVVVVVVVQLEGEGEGEHNLQMATMNQCEFHA
jgi:hypothetical protein